MIVIFLYVYSTIHLPHYCKNILPLLLLPQCSKLVRLSLSPLPPWSNIFKQGLEPTLRGSTRVSYEDLIVIIRLKQKWWTETNTLTYYNVYNIGDSISIETKMYVGVRTFCLLAISSTHTKVSSTWTSRTWRVDLAVSN